MVNVRSWDNLLISTLKVSLLITAVIIIYQEINLTAVVENVENEILLHETQELSASKETAEFLESDYDENELYQVENISIE